MPGPGRNDPCPCGSGRKTKRCCGEQRGPSPDQLARAHLAALAHQASDDLFYLSDEDLDRLREDVFNVPGLDLALHVRLPELGVAERRRLQRAMTDPDDDGAWETVTAVARRLDTPQERARLADVVVRLRAQGKLGRRTAAFAIFDLGSGSGYVLMASTIHALATYLGGDATPAGLLVAA